MQRFSVFHTECSMVWGGQEIRVLDEAFGMIKRGHHVVLGCQPGSAILKHAEERGVPVFVSEMHGALDFSGIGRFKSYLRDNRFDIVNTHGSKDSWTVLIASRLAGRSINVRSRHNSAPVGPSLKGRFMYGCLVDGVSTTGEKVREHVVSVTDLTSDKVVSIPTGIDMERFDPSAVDGKQFRLELGVPDDAPLIGTVGKLQTYKGPEYFIDAAALILKQFPKARFVMVGEAMNAQDLERKQSLISRMESQGIADRIIMTGFRNDIPNVMAALDVFVLASVSNEGVPQVVNQALAMRVPVVGTDVGCVSEQVLTGRTGYLVQPADSTQIAESVIALLSDLDAARKMGEQGRVLVNEKFSMDAMLNATEKFYAYLMSCK